MKYLAAAGLLLTALTIAAVLFRHRWYAWLCGYTSFGSWSPLVRELDKTPKAPVVHEGATEAYGAELHNAAKKLPSPDLIRPAEQMVADHEALNEISKALDDFDRTVSDAISRFLRNQPTVLLRLPSSIEHTGELPVVEMAVAG